MTLAAVMCPAALNLEQVKHESDFFAAVYDKLVTVFDCIPIEKVEAQYARMFSMLSVNNETKALLEFRQASPLIRREAFEVSLRTVDFC